MSEAPREEGLVGHSAGAAKQRQHLEKPEVTALRVWTCRHWHSTLSGLVGQLCRIPLGGRLEDSA